jgi:hypothetical protein
MIYEIINPSDAYTMVAESFHVAAAAVLLLGQGKLGLSCEEDPEQHVPVMLFGGAEEWLKKHGLEDLSGFIESHKGEVATALESVLIGDIIDRKTFERVLSVIKDQDERNAARAAYHDEKRSSMNDIGRAAWIYAAALRKQKTQGR